MNSDFLIAVTQWAAERGLPKESVVSAVEAALASAYKKDSTAAGHDITVKLDPANGAVQLFTTANPFRLELSFEWIGQRALRRGNRPRRPRFRFE